MSEIDLLIKKRIRLALELWRDIRRAEKIRKTQSTIRARQHLGNLISDIHDLKEKRNSLS